VTHYILGYFGDAGLYMVATLERAITWKGGIEYSHQTHWFQAARVEDVSSLYFATGLHF